MPRTNYDQVVDGDTFVIETGQDLHLACCGCLMAHVFKFRKVRNGIAITLFRDNRITAALQRHNRKNKQHEK